MLEISLIMPIIILYNGFDNSLMLETIVSLCLLLIYIMVNVDLCNNYVHELMRLLLWRFDEK